MKKILVWDLAVRCFHWSFAGALLGALGIAYLAGKHSPLFQWHMVLGIIACFLLVLRVGLGLVGSRYARFTRFPLGPAEVGRYFAAVFTGRGGRYVGHNPGSALAALAMFALVPALLLTGLAGTQGPWEEIHEALAYGLSGVIGAHLAGLAWAAGRHRENVLQAMISGRKDGAAEEGLASAHPVWGVGFILVASAWIAALLSSHDAAAARVRLPWTGPTIQLGENEGREVRRVKEKRKHRDSHHD